MSFGAFRVLGDVLRDNAERFGAKPAFVFGDTVRSFAEVDARVDRLARALVGRGLGKGDRVAILSRNRPEYFEVVGAGCAGLISVPLNWRLSVRELLHPLTDAAPAVLVAEPAFAPLIDGLRPQLGSVRHFVLFGPAREGWESYEELLSSAADEVEVEPADPLDPICLVYSSGTTGVPKGAVLTHYGVLANARANAEDMLGLSSEDVALATMPLFHVGGLWYHLVPSFAAGNTTVILPEFEPATVLRTVQEQGVTQLHLVPTMIGMLLDQPGVAQMDLGRLRMIFYAASSIPPVLLKRAMTVFRNCGFVQSFGSTEAGSTTALMPADHRRALEGREDLLRSCGHPLGTARIEIRGADGCALPTGEVGEIAVAGDRTMLGYWNNAVATAATMVGGWLYTGDLGRVDAEGYLYIVDRKHDMIVTGGENVYPREVEDVLHDDPDVAEVAVFAIPDPKWVERVAAAVVLKPGHRATAEDIRRRAATTLAPYKCPKTVIFVEQLPKNGAGKVLKRALREQYAEHPVS